MSGWRRCGRMLILALLAAVLWSMLWLGWGVRCTVCRRAEEAAAAVGGPYAALTFDDGPRTDTTSLLLDGLADRGISATFFIVGSRIDGREDILRRMAAEGHQIGIQSQTHAVLAGMDEGGLAAEVTALCGRLTDLLGQEEFMIRPPYGELDQPLLQWLDMPVILWSVDPMDWADHDSARQTADVLAAVEDGSVILLHDIYHASVDTALAVADELTARGYTLVTVEELMALRGIAPEAGQVYRKFPP